MASTVVSWNKGRSNKRTLYVGGLDEQVDDKLLQAAFVPFGDVKEVSVPVNFATGKHRGFGFVEFENREDADAAIDNMHCAEINGRVLTVNYAQPMKAKAGELGVSNKPVWADTDTYMKKLEDDSDKEDAMEKAERDMQAKE
mmetsp:Transcript_10562/g.26789  ORF Transcript_10562/g.26789 Transcript_10562/m.26789 type:complete len:142 (+) Transcript_10562:219-644(+)|eukprot:CAMPEP_0198235350 /NCGR_PEP_ID=MMETSP1446-20131203/1263_1 /TAXON_ID=1461542 ORGANISM="Unidentified sp, Strain CCMP2111" /NCGR_SAMPLE_ID=MMETSP1446 /ASSEMBLY_ACC=CAM_ASM_001112 /LENGTH=141 /DNA_ID=CAMNT_0043916485 /DNA_START=130 /DNA_END=555 /DNA_ORIENTATION=+